MRQQLLTGYVLHHKPYKEKGALIYFFSQEYGVVHGVGKKNPPLFLPMSLYATGKTALKTFSQIEVASVQPQLLGESLYAGLYLNELLLKLLPQQEAYGCVLQAYQQAINALQSCTDRQTLMLILREFERHFLSQLGYAIDFSQDSQGEAIQATCYYRYVLNAGFVPTAVMQPEPIAGAAILAVAKQGVQLAHLLWLTRVHKQVVDSLLDGKMLQSRQLWQSLYQ